MRPFLAAVSAVIVIALGSTLILERVPIRADQEFYSKTSVRIPDHGNTHNLVGKSWWSARDH
jgi:hypothetical protein